MSRPDWKQVKEYEDITYHKCDGVARIAFNRPEVRNAFRPDTLLELQEAFRDAGEDTEIGVVLLTGNGPAKDGKYAFCSGGDQRVRGEAGYVGKRWGAPPERPGAAAVHPEHAQARHRSWWPGTPSAVATSSTSSATSPSPPTMPSSVKPGPKVGSFDGGFGASYLASIVGQKKAREIWYPLPPVRCGGGPGHGAGQRRGSVEELEAEGWRWAQEILDKSPLSIRLLKSAFNAGGGRTGRDSGAGRELHPSLLHDGGGPGGQERLHREAEAELPEVSVASLVGRFVAAGRHSRPEGDAPPGGHGSWRPGPGP